MKTTKLVFAIACVLGLVASSFAQNAGTKKSPGILGYLDPKTGVFRTLPTPVTDSAEPAATTVFGGTFVVTFTITVKSAIATSAKISCSVTASLIDAETTNPSIIEEEAAVVATRSGSTATCTVTIPYSWNLATGSTDKVTLAYSLVAPVEATATTAFPQRLSTQDIATISVPANGKTTDETVTATF